MSAYRPYPSYKDSGVEWLGDVPEGWDVSRLGFEAWVRARLGWKGLKAEEYVDEGYAFLATPNIKGENIDFENVNFISLMRFNESPEIKISEGDVLLAKDGSTLGIVNVVRHLPRPTTVNSSIAVITPSGRIDGVFLYYLFRSSYMGHTIQRIKGGMGVPHLFQADLNKFSMPHPPLPEQHQIAAFLDRECGKLDALQAKQERLIELLKEKRQALISHAVTRGLDPAAKLKPSGIEWLGDVPEHWRTLKLGHVCKLQGGFAFKADEFGDEGIPVIRMKNLSRGILDIEEVARVPIASTNSSVALRAGDLLWGMSGSVGDTGSLGNYAVVSVDDLPAQLNQRVGRFLPNTSKLQNEFLCRAIQASSFYEQILLEVTGTAQFNVSSSQVESCYIALPPLAEQLAIVAHLDEKCGKIDKLKAKAERAIELLKERRSALISAAVTGKIDVRNESLP